MSDAGEFSSSGAPIYRHQRRLGEPPIAEQATPFLAKIERHISRWIGPAPMVFHELVSPEVHIDLHVVPPTGREPTEEHPYGSTHYTVVTSGMSSRPMKVPNGADDLQYAELMIALPHDWPGMKADGTFDQGVMKDEAKWWPLRWLKTIARLPHEYDTFIAMGHTIPNGDPAEPFAENTKLCCMMVGPAILVPRAGRQLSVNADVTINFYALWPLYEEEMQLKLDEGLDVLADRLADAGLTERIDPWRKNVCCA